MKEYEVTIRETLEMKVNIKANTHSEAEDTVEQNWIDKKYVLDSEHFKGANFEARPAL
jgi:hypothetical protein